MALKTVYVIPYDATQTQTLRTVNIKTVTPGRVAPGPPAPFPYWRQSMTAPVEHEFATVMAAGDANSTTELVGNCHMNPYDSVGGYHTNGVHFTSSMTEFTSLKCNSLTGLDNGVASYSFWFNNATVYPPNYPVYFSSGVGNTACTGDGAGLIQGVIFGNVSGSNFFGLGGFPVTDAWHHLLVSANVSGTVIAVYLDDVKIDSSFAVSAGTPTGVFQTGQPFYVGVDTYSGGDLNGDMADFWFAPGVSLLDGNGDIPVADRRLFISASGKPVDPAGFPAGAAVQFTNGVTGWQTNAGSGGAFTVVNGTLTTSSTSPSD